MARIKSNHPVREDFAACSTGCQCGAGRTGYYGTKGDAVSAFEAALAGHSYRFDCDEFISLPGDDGRITPSVCDGERNRVGFAVLYWHRMPSGKYEFTGYLA